MSDDITIALIATMPSTLAAATGLVVAVLNHRQLKGNGRGTHTQMLEALDDKVDNLATSMSDHMAEDRRMFDQVFQSLDLFAEELKSIIRTGHSDRNGLR